MLGAIVPHAPILAPGLESPEVADAARRIRDAVDSISLPDVVVIISPHGRETGVYARAEGSLDAFGVPDMTVHSDEESGLAAELARVWERPLLRDPADHGVTVPILIGCKSQTTIGVAFAEGEAQDELEKSATALSDSIARLDGDVALIASVHGAAGLTPRAPLTERSRSKALDQELVAALAREPARIEQVARELTQTEASCSFGPLAALVRARPDATFDIRAREAPVGVSYIIAVENP